MDPGSLGPSTRRVADEGAEHCCIGSKEQQQGSFFFHGVPSKESVARGRQCSHYAWCHRRRTRLSVSEAPWLPASRQTHGSGESKAAFCLLPLFHLLRVSAAASRPGQHCRPVVTVTAGKPRHRPNKKENPGSTWWSKESRKPCART